MAENITTLTIEEMNNTVRKANPELYDFVFKSGNIAVLAGGSIIVFPLIGLRGSAALYNIYEMTPMIVGVVIGLIASIILNLIFWIRERERKTACADLLALAETIFPQAILGFGKTGLVFPPKAGEHQPSQEA